MLDKLMHGGKYLRATLDRHANHDHKRQHGPGNEAKQRRTLPFHTAEQIAAENQIDSDALLLFPEEDWNEP